jgi:site-specific DNA recombinase
MEKRSKNTSNLVDCRRGAVYCRVSSAAQEDNSSLGTQEAACRKFAFDHGIDVVEVFREVHTGTDLFERPELIRMRDATRRGAFDIVIAYALDRLSRDPVHLGVILSEAEHHSVAVEFVSEPFDDSPEGQLIRFVRGYAAKVEHMKITERSVRGRKARAESGKLLPGAKAPYGYRWRDETKAALEIDEGTAPVVQRIFREASAGVPLRRIAIDLTKDGIPTPMQRSHVWSSSTIHEILRRRAYFGEAAAWGWKRPRNHAQVYDSSKAIALPDGTIPPLIDQGVWESIQPILANNKVKAIRNAREPEAALLRAGYVLCGHCRRKMLVRPVRGGAYCYYCHDSAHSPVKCTRHGMQAHLLDDIVWRKVTEILMNPDLVKREMQRILDEDRTAADLKVVDRQLKDIEKQQSNLATAIGLLERSDALAPLVNQLEALSERHEQLLRERAQIQSRRSAWEAMRVTLDGFNEWSATIANRIEQLSFKEKRMVLDALGVYAVVYRSEHDPRYEIFADIDPSVVSSTNDDIYPCARPCTAPRRCLLR